MDEWITVTKGGRRAPPTAKNVPSQAPFKYKGVSRETPSLDLDKMIDSCVAEVRISKAWIFTAERLKLLCPISLTICYGIGSFADVKRSRYQVAFLFLIIELLQPKEARICDPVLACDEITFLKRRGLVVAENDEASFRATSPVLFFLPHCGRRLYSNLLCANWGHELHNVILIGNSFDNFVLRALPQQKTTKFVRLAHKFATEISLPNDIGAGDALNDTSLHIFAKDKLSSVADTVWSDCAPEPRDPDDREIVYRDGHKTDG